MRHTFPTNTNTGTGHCMDEPNSSASNSNNQSSATSSGKGGDSAASKTGPKQRGGQNSHQSNTKRNAARRPPNTKFGKPRYPNRSAPNSSSNNNNNSTSNNGVEDASKAGGDVINGEGGKKPKARPKRRPAKTKTKIAADDVINTNDTNTATDGAGAGATDGPGAAAVDHQEGQPQKKKKNNRKKKRPTTAALSGNHSNDATDDVMQQPTNKPTTADPQAKPPKKSKPRNNNNNNNNNSNNNKNKHFIDLALIDNGQHLSSTTPQHDVITDTNDTAAAADDVQQPKKKNKPKKSRSKPSKMDKATKKVKLALIEGIQSFIKKHNSKDLIDLLHSDAANIALDTHTIENLLQYMVTSAMFGEANFVLSRYCEGGSVSLGAVERCLGSLPQNMRQASPYQVLAFISGLSMVSNLADDTVRSYWLRVVQGAVLEFVEECTSCRDRICSTSIPTTTLHVEVNNSSSHLIVHLNPNNTNKNSDYRVGDAVGLLPYIPNSRVSAEALDQLLIDGSILRVHTNLANNDQPTTKLTIKLSNGSDSILTRLRGASRWRVDKLANRMALTRQIAAVCSICDDVSNVFSRILVGGASSSTNGNGNGNVTVPQLCSEMVSTATPSDDVIKDLNSSQTAAISGAVRRRVSLIQGPPGTGKTAVAIRIIRHWCDTNIADNNGYKILACSDSNIAVDNLVAGCAAAGLAVVRLGRPEAITNPKLLEYTLTGTGSNNNNNRQLHNAQVICCTCMGAVLGASTIINKVSHVLVDEATQCTEAAILVPMALASTHHDNLKSVVLIGDHCQLPPTVLSTLATTHCASDIPLFTRLRLQSKVHPLLLNTQYRMHPAISMFVSDLFYGGLLIDGVHPHQRRPLAGFPWPRVEFPVAFVPIRCSDHNNNTGNNNTNSNDKGNGNNGGEQTDSQTNSKYNTAEAHAAVDVVEMLLEGGQCTVHDIAVVTPYIAQVRLIRRLLRRLINNNNNNNNNGNDDSNYNNIEVSSTDGFQGREKEAVIFSAVRSNVHGNIGFTSDWRRVNVSFTRARRALIVIGDDVTLRKGDAGTWSPWLAWADAHGVNMDKPGVMRGRYDPEQLRRVRGEQENLLRDFTLQAVLNSVSSSSSGKEGSAATMATTMPGTNGNDNVGQGKTGEGETGPVISLEDDIANMANTDGHWDDASDEEGGDDGKGEGVSSTYNESSRNTSVADLSAAVDAWDL